VTIAARTSVATERVKRRPFYVSLWWTLRDYAKRTWDNSGEDNVLFLAGGIAFNLILAGPVHPSADHRRDVHPADLP